MEELIFDEVPEAPFYPKIVMNPDSGVCEISGESYMEETYKYYSPVLKWINEYIEKNGKITLNIKLTYFNTSSSRQLLDILHVLKKYQTGGGEVSVIWYYDPEDPDMQDEVEDFVLETGLEIKMVNL